MRRTERCRQLLRDGLNYEFHRGTFSIKTSIFATTSGVVMSFSVLIAVYNQEQPHFLQQALESLLQQTRLPNEVIVVEDGPLTPALNEVLARFQRQYKMCKRIAKPRQEGLGLALNEGLKYCQYDIVARMDSDDVCMPQRFEKQLSYLQTHPEVDVVGAWVAEFATTPTQIISVRCVPEIHQAIRKFARFRNPMNHPTVMFRKAKVVQAGGYRHMPAFEDYDLWVRMLQQGACFHNLQECLLWFRLNANTFRRRGGVNYIAAEMHFQKGLVRLRFLTPIQAFGNMMMRLGVRLLPTFLRKKFYLAQLRIAASTVVCSPDIVKKGGEA